MDPSLVLQFRSDVSLARVADEQVRLEFAWGNAALGEITPGLLAVLERLSCDGATEDDLSELVLETDGFSALARFYYYLERFGKLGILRYTLIGDGGPLATVVPMCGGFHLPTRSDGPDTRFRLSRFAYCRREGDGLALETPCSPARTILHGRSGVALLAELSSPRSCHDLCALIGGLGEDTVRTFLTILASLGVVGEVDSHGNLVEDTDSVMVQWEFHDLLFHSRSRTGRHDYAVGGTYRFLGKVAPEPALKPTTSAPVVLLRKPDLLQVERKDPSFTSVLENRKSLRAYGTQPITAARLGEFLYRVARVRRLTEPDPTVGLHYQSSNRPYPSGGATYDLELYVTVNNCADLPRGLYHYDALDHQLEKLADHGPRVEALLRDAQLAVRLADEPQILITLTSRFQRVSWKYSGIAYALTLKHVGVLFQTMYLVATAMELAPCAVGTGNSDLFAEAAGTNYFAETSVGEFLLGSAPA